MTATEIDMSEIVKYAGSTLHALDTPHWNDVDDYTVALIELVLPDFWVQI